MKNNDTLPLYDKLMKKIYAYYQTIWRDKWKEGISEEWLMNFEHIDPDTLDKERINMLYLLSKFMYFGNNELRQLLIALYRDLFKYPIIEKIRRNNGDTVDVAFIENGFYNELYKTRFLGVGNPSESGVHMLYYFRQEHNLPKDFFIHSSEIFSTVSVSDQDRDGNIRKYLKSSIANSAINRYIFIDDFCGSGSQASKYLKHIVENIKFENPNIEVHYLMLFATEFGISEIRKLKIFDKVEAVFTIDDTFKAYSDNSRYFSPTLNLDPIIDKDFSRTTANSYGATLFVGAPLGYRDCQLLLGLYHNTPDNSLPIFWSQENSWKPIFKRYQKIY